MVQKLYGGFRSTLNSTSPVFLHLRPSGVLYLPPGHLTLCILPHICLLTPYGANDAHRLLYRIALTD